MVDPHHGSCMGVAHHHFILKQRNWRCDIQPAIDELGYQPKVKLEEGVKRSIKWYKENGWL